MSKPAIKRGRKVKPGGKEGYDEIPIRLPSGTKAVVWLPRPFTLADGVHLMNFLEGYIEEKEPAAATQQGESK